MGISLQYDPSLQSERLCRQSRESNRPYHYWHLFRDPSRTFRDVESCK